MALHLSFRALLLFLSHLFPFGFCFCLFLFLFLLISTLRSDFTHWLCGFVWVLFLFCYESLGISLLHFLAVHCQNFCLQLERIYNLRKMSLKRKVVFAKSTRSHSAIQCNLFKLRTNYIRTYVGHGDN